MNVSWVAQYRKQVREQKVKKNETGRSRLS